MKSFKELARHINDEIEFIENTCTNLSLSDFENNQLIKRAVIRSIEIIGEAVKNMPVDILEQYPDVEWKNIARSRDILIHHYFGVDYEIVWDIVKFHIPFLKDAIIELLTKP